MLITHQLDRYIAICSFTEKETVKGLGFRWDPGARRWWTQDWQKALALGPYCDGAAQAAIAKARDDIVPSGEIPDPSRAVDTDLLIPVPPGIEYLGFQKAGIAFALDHETTLIADQPGLGKTIQALGVINADASIRSALIVCPASVKINWRREAKKWLVREFTIGIAGETFPNTAIVIINYDVLKKFRACIRARQWDLAVFDESHLCKNPSAQRTAEVFGQRANKPKGRERIDPIMARRKLFLTGTPILNRPIELWPILKSLGWNWLEFVTRYCNAKQHDVYKKGGKKQAVWDTTGASNLHELQQKLRAQFMVRRLKKDVLTELPPKRWQIIELSANGAGSLIEQEMATLRRAFPNASPEEYYDLVSELKSADGIAFNELARRRHELALAKVPLVIEHLTEAIESSEKIILFGYHKDALEQIRMGLTKASIKSVVVTGDITDLNVRQRAVDQFQENLEIGVFIGTIGAAGVGLTLTASSHVVFAELDWVPGIMSQAEDRAHRKGQRDAVLVQHLVFEGSLDAHIAQTLVSKQQIIEAALDG